MDQSILLSFYNFTSGSTALSLLVIFCAKWLPYFVVFMAALCVICHRMPAESKASFKMFFTVENLPAYFFQLFFTFFPAIAAFVAADGIKFFFPAIRPFAALNFMPLVLGENPMASFPSTHASIFAALAVTIFFHNKKIGVWFLLGALVIGLARIAAGIHWPSDILAGFLFGGLVAYFSEYFWLEFSKKYPN